MMITVTAEDIKDGACYRPSSCPIALAAAREGLESVLVGAVRMHFGPMSTKTAVLPHEAIEFIKNFDAGLPVAPFAFELVMAP